jgi:uncharacterized protein YggE
MAFFLLLVAGVLGVFMAVDLFVLFFFYELAIFPMYFLIVIWGWVQTREYAAMKLTLYILVGSIVALVGLLALMTGAAYAQDTPSNSLTVDGFGQAYGAPDVAYIQLGVQIADSDVNAAFNQVNETMNAIIAAITELGIDPKDQQTTGLFMYPETAYDPQTGAPTGETTYRVNNSLTVTVRDVSKVGEVITTGVNAGANNIGSLNFGIADTDALESEARTAAVADARERASQLAEALGVQLGDPIIVVESLANNTPSPVAMRADSFAFGGAAPIQEGQLSVAVQVRITFALG